MSDPVPHPAKFNQPILDAINKLVDDEAFWGVDSALPLRLLDPFAGTGKIFDLEAVLYGRVRAYGIEIEPEWARHHPLTQVGDALALPFAASFFDIIATSPTYGNRMADHHVAKDSSKRMTYTHQLGRPLSDSNSGQLHWGEAYFQFHRDVWAETDRVLRRGGIFILNAKDFMRTRTIRKNKVKEVVPVVNWHVDHLVSLGYSVERDVMIPVTGMGFGANGQSRVNHERVIQLRKPLAS